MELSQPFGEVAQVHIPIDWLSKQPTSAIVAYEALDNMSFQGHLLHIIFGIDKFEVVEDEGQNKH